jgi:hypothetical protein
MPRVCISGLVVRYEHFRDARTYCFSTFLRSCGATPLRLTSDHLVAVRRAASEWALTAAGSLIPGDTLFSDLARSRTCRVLSVAAETAQSYLGLNCRDSLVLADGVLVSTFGRCVHSLCFRLLRMF